MTIARSSLLWQTLRERSQGIECIDGQVANMDMLAESYRDMEHYNAWFGGLSPCEKLFSASIRVH